MQAQFEQPADARRFLPIEFGYADQRLIEAGVDAPQVAAVRLTGNLDGDVGRPGDIVAARQSERQALRIGDPPGKGKAPLDRPFLGEILTPRPLSGHHAQGDRPGHIQARLVEGERQRPAAYVDAVEQTRGADIGQG